MKKVSSLLFGFAFLAMAFAPFQTAEKVMMHMESKTLMFGKLSVSKADVFYQNNGDLIIHGIYPKESMTINNNKGEVFYYDPQKNTVFQKSDFSLSTDNSQFHYFLQNKRSDMGMRSMGFTMEKTEVKDGLVISLWMPPVNMRHLLTKVKLVHKAGNPIYAGYYNEIPKEVKKVYYSDFFQSGSMVFPQKITQFDYLPNGDSIVTKTVYSDIKVNQQANSAYFTYKVPANAIVVKTTTED